MLISGAPVCSKHRVVHVVGAGTRVPVCDAALESLIDATVRGWGFFARRVAHLAAFPALAFPQVTDTAGNPMSTSARVVVNRAAGEVLVCAAIGSVLHLIVQRPAQRAAFCLCGFVASEDFAPDGVGSALAAPTNLAVFIALDRAANPRDGLVLFVRGWETEGAVFPLLCAVGTVDSISGGVCAVPSGPVDLAAAVELDKSTVAQGD